MASLPAVSPSQETGDVWENIFPVEKASYRLHDEEDGLTRCPNCLHEIYNEVCPRCDAEFSEDDIGSDEEDDVHLDSDREDSDQWTDEEAERIHRMSRGRPLNGGEGRRRARVDIATIEEVLGAESPSDQGMSCISVLQSSLPGGNAEC